MSSHGMDAGDRLALRAGTLTSLRVLGRDEHWLQDWLCEDLERLGLGPLKLIQQELTQAHGGQLDILASNGDTYYSIEVQLGEVDASHGFRTFDYWARNRRRFPGATHVAVLVAESTVGRFRVVLEELAELTPLLVVELRSWRGGQEAVIVPELVIRNASLDVSNTPLAATTGESRTEEDWKDLASQRAWDFHLAFRDWVEEHLGPVTVDYSPKSYIGVRVGRRVWAPLWLRTDGAYTYLPDPDHSRNEESPAFEYFHDLLADQFSLSWQVNYNAGANPISLRLRRDDLGNAGIQELLRTTYEAVTPGSTDWSQKRKTVAHEETSEAVRGAVLPDTRGQMGQPQE